MSSNETRRFSTYRAVTDQIVAAIEAGATNAELPWHRDAGLLMPVNAFTEKRYRGVNVVALWAATASRGFSSHLWATYRQWCKLGAQVRRSETASLVVFFKEIAVESDGNPEGGEAPSTRLVARASRVFNADQVDGYERPAPAAPPQPVAIITEAERVVGQTGAVIHHGGSAAYYSPSGDYIQIPERETFTGTKTSTPTEGYYGVLFHELTHWSGAPERLARDLSGRFGSRSYAMEELVAELGAAFLCAELAITPAPREDHAAYIADWLKVLKHDPRAIFTAASRAGQATDYVLGESQGGRTS